MSEYITTEQARQYFKDKNLDYKMIGRKEIEFLNRLIEKELVDYFLSGDSHAYQMDMSVSRLLKKDFKFSENGLEYAYLHVDGSYFKRRESVSFHQNGFIGFCGELSSVNSQPILKGFIKWCDWMKEAQND